MRHSTNSQCFVGNIYRLIPWYSIHIYLLYVLFLFLLTCLPIYVELPLIATNYTHACIRAYYTSLTATATAHKQTKMKKKKLNNFFLFLKIYTSTTEVNCSRTIWSCSRIKYTHTCTKSSYFVFRLGLLVRF